MAVFDEAEWHANGELPRTARALYKYLSLKDSQPSSHLETYRH